MCCECFRDFPQGFRRAKECHRILWRASGRILKHNDLYHRTVKKSEVAAPVKAPLRGDERAETGVTLIDKITIISAYGLCAQFGSGGIALTFGTFNQCRPY